MLGTQDRRLRLEAPARNAVEGVAFSLADGHAALAAAGTALSEAAALGGGSNSAFWLRLVAAATGMRLLKPQEADRGGAFGAARLAMLAFGCGPAEALCTPPAAAVIEPDAALRSRLDARLERYRRLYGATRGLMSAG